MNDNKNQQHEGQPSENNMYYDTLLNTEEYKPNSGVDENGNPLANEGKNTGSGVEAAVGTDYSWNKQGEAKANTAYEQEVNNAKQNLLTNRQTMENNAVNYQAESDMMKYQNNQNAEKVGWTGGYVLDQNRQMDYLKQSIQAQMYGAMELQKYGYDSALAAARLSYDLNQQEYARQYYQEAVSAALSEAQLTGTYFSAETKDMMSQLAVAQQKKDDQSLTEEERDQAKRLEEQIQSWFQSNGISKEGVKTLEAWQQESQIELQRSQEMWERYNAAIKAAQQDLAENSSLFFQLDENGNIMFDGNNALTGNWDSMSKEEILDYIMGQDLDENGNVRVNQVALNQYYSYLDSTLTGQLESGFAQWCKSKGYITVDEQGNQTTKGNFGKYFERYLAESGVVQSIFNNYKELIDKMGKIDKNSAEYKRIAEFQRRIEDWDFTIRLPDGTDTTLTYSGIKNSSGENSNSGQKGETQTQTLQYVDSDGNTQTLQYTWTPNYMDTGNGKTGYNGDTYYSTSFTINGQQYNIVFTTGEVTNVDNKNETNFDNDDIEVKLFEGDASGTNHDNGYGVEVANDTSDDPILSAIIAGLTLSPLGFAAGVGGSAVANAATGGTDADQTFNNFIEMLYYQQTGQRLKGGTVMVINGHTYFYNTKADGPYKNAQEGLYGIEQQACSNNNLNSALQSSGQWTN